MSKYKKYKGKPKVDPNPKNNLLKKKKKAQEKKT